MTGEKNLAFAPHIHSSVGSSEYILYVQLMHSIQILTPEQIEEVSQKTSTGLSDKLDSNHVPICIQDKT